MPRPAAALAALVLAAGSAFEAAAETKPNAAPSSATPPAALRQAPVMQTGVAILSLERKFNIPGWEIVAKLSNASAEAAPKGSHGIELKCTSSMAAARTVRRVLHDIGGHGQLDIAIFRNQQSAPVAPGPTPVGPPIPNFFNPFGSGDNSEFLSQQAPLTAGLPWSCSVSVATNPGRPGSGVAKTIAWGVEFDYGISDISFEKAMSAPPTVNVRVAVLSKKTGNAPLALPVAGDLRKLRLACSKPGEASKNAESPAADSVLFGTANAGFLPAPASGWSCRATLVGAGADLDPSNDTWALTAP
jgi:hypothetical protein